jgi:superoxide reductase
MAERMEVYSCEACGNIVFVLDGGPGDLICCGEPMELCREQTADSAVEKHVPVIEKIDGGFKITVGSTLHPMTDEHWIEWIEVNADGKNYRQFLNPGDEPVATFMIDADTVMAREYCNVHGLWQA